MGQKHIRRSRIRVCFKPALTAVGCLSKKPFFQNIVSGLKKLFSFFIAGVQRHKKNAKYTAF